MKPLHKFCQIAFIAVSSLLFSCQKPVDLVIINAKVWTGDLDNPLADMVAVSGNRIAFVGWQEDLPAELGEHTTVIDARGRLVIPGFNDAHLHFLSGGLSLLQVNLTGCKSKECIKNRLEEKTEQLPSGAWITGRGWDHTVFNQGEWPTKDLLDEVAPDHPVFVRRIDGHVGWANSLALKKAGIDAQAAVPEGGEMLLDPQTGQPTGIFKESAMSLVSKVIPEPNDSLKLAALRLAHDHAVQLGVTSVQDQSGISSMTLYHHLMNQGHFQIRVSEWLDFDLTRRPDSLVGLVDSLEILTEPFKLETGMLKGFVDGTLGSRTAYFFDPYSDDPTTVGLPQYTADELNRMVCVAESLKFQIGLHCIGARANRMALDAYDVARQTFGSRDSRHRLEHAQVLRIEDIPRIKELGVIASMQPTHCTSDLRWAEQRLGLERSKGAYAWKSLQNAGVRLAFGTDWPVEPLDPMRGIYSAVTRKHIDTGEPKEGWFPEERLSVRDAIRAYTLGSAFSEFKEDEKGTLTKGKLADMIMLSKDILVIQPEEILHTRVLMTIIDGRIVYQEKESN